MQQQQQQQQWSVTIEKSWTVSVQSSSSHSVTAMRNMKILIGKLNCKQGASLGKQQFFLFKMEIVPLLEGVEIKRFWWVVGSVGLPDDSKNSSFCNRKCPFLNILGYSHFATANRSKFHEISTKLFHSIEKNVSSEFQSIW